MSVPQTSTWEALHLQKLRPRYPEGAIVSDERRGIPPGWTSYMEADADGGVSEVLRRDPIYASREYAWAEYDREWHRATRDAARDGALAFTLAQAALITEQIALDPWPEDLPMPDFRPDVAQAAIDLAAIFKGTRDSSTYTHPEEMVVREWAKMIDQIRGEDR